MVSRGEDIVINRDHVDEMERGEMTPEEKTDVESSPTDGSAPATLSQKDDHEVGEGEGYHSKSRREGEGGGFPAYAGRRGAS